MLRLAIVLAALLVQGVVAVAAAAPLDFAGTWRGTVQHHDPGIEAPQGEVVLVVTPSSDRFSLRWTVPGGRTVESSFAPTKQPGVYRAEEGGMFSMFGRRSVGNPLADGQLLWAREAGDALYVYTLTIDRTGRYGIDRLEFLRRGDALGVTLTRQSTGHEPRSMVANLQRVGS
ncbi:MAG TPA: hypothetical protein VFG43_04085 [Geminicoccaceae bacterium]|nr:hypothetical protein [Geminicoccaceae bacterium]